MEAAFSLLEDALRNRLDLIVDWVGGQPDAGDDLLAVKLQCENARDAETEELMKAYPKIDKAFANPVPEYEPLEKIDGELRQLRENYEGELTPYNAMISKFPWKWMKNL